MLILKLIVLLVNSALFWVGGKWNHNARRFVMPLVISSYCAWGHAWWLIPAIWIPMAGVLCLGYGDKSPLRHIFGDGWGRGIWGLLVGLAASLGLFLGHFMIHWLFFPSWVFLVLYLAINFTLENALKKLPQDIGDPLIGASISSIILLI